MQVQAVQDVGLQPAVAGAGTGLEAFVQQVLVAEADATPLLFQLLIELVDRRIAVLVERAKTVIGNYWTERDRVTHERPRSEWSRLGVRARLHRGNLRIEWFVQHWHRQSGTKGRWLTFSKHLPKGRGTRYVTTVFKPYVKDWELPLIEKCEDRLDSIRREAAMLAELRKGAKRRLSDYQKHQPR
ncbi:MAG: conjugative transfer protein MobI(A/C) [Candidatus Competibacteraceae bacterium]